MNYKFSYITCFFIFIYLISTYSIHLLNYKNDWLFISYYFVQPIAILLSVVIFKTNLEGKISFIFRIGTAIVLLAGLCLGIYFWSTCNQLGCIVLLVLGLPALLLALIMYLTCYTVQWFKKSNKVKNLRLRLGRDKSRPF